LGGRSPVHGTNFWGASNLDNMVGGGNTWHTLSFSPTDVSGRPYSEISFLYFANGLSAPDSLGYIVEMNGGGEWNLANYIALDNTAATGWQRITIPLTGADGDVRIQLMAKFSGTGETVGFEDVRFGFLDSGTRIFGNYGLSNVKHDLEPEYVVVNQNSTTAYAVCQENNCVVIIDLITKSITNIKGLGFKNHIDADKGFDATDQDGMINIIPRPTLGIYEPDALAGFTIDDDFYFISANEGDTREYDAYIEEVRVSSRTLDPIAYPDGNILKQNSVMGRLKTTISMGDVDYDGDVDQIYSFGARSFSIWDANVDQVFDSGDDFEQYTAAFNPTFFNASNDNNTLDNRSDDKGPEPEGVQVLEKYGRHYAFTCLERVGGVMVYDVTNPQVPQFIQYLNHRDFTMNVADAAALDVGPEGLMIIPAASSPNERDLLVVSNEMSGTVSIFQLDINRIISGDMVLETFDLNTTDTAGVYNDEVILEGGASGLFYKDGSNNEFYIVSDRGPNADAVNHELATGPTLHFPFPDYAPKIHEIQTAGEEIFITNTTTIKRPGGADATGIPLPANAGSTGEAAWSDLNATPISPDTWGIDSEGIALGNDGNFWVCDEYGSSIWQLNQQGEVLQRFTPFPNELEDMPLDSMIGKRRANRGFEGIAWTPNGKVYSMLQSPVNNPNAIAGNASRIHRMVELDPQTGETKTFVYVHKPEIGEIRERDWKIGDLVAINNHEFLLLEHAERNGWNYKNVVKISIENATPIVSEDFNGMTLEQLISEDSLSTHGIVPAQRSMFLDLLELGWNTDHDKPEGLAIMNDSTIAVINDNDFGINSPLLDGNIVMTGKQTRLYVYHLNADQHLDYVSPYCSVTVNVTDTSFCEGESAELIASGEFESFVWNEEVNNTNINADSTATYHLVATTQEGCADFATVDVIENPLPTVQLGEDFALCPDSTSVLQIPNAYTSVLWSDATADTAYIVVANELMQELNEITVQAENEFGCFSADTVLVLAASIPVVSLEDVYNICEGGNQIISTGNAADAHVWSTDETTNEISASTPGEYSVTVTNQYGCMVMDTTQLNVWQYPTLELGDDLEICDTIDYFL
ncbi:MAG: choice-of-anchor I family protein, partial [Flavobacteriales bacterium]